VIRAMLIMAEPVAISRLSTDSRCLARYSRELSVSFLGHLGGIPYTRISRGSEAVAISRIKHRFTLHCAIICIFTWQVSWEDRADFGLRRTTSGRMHPPLRDEHVMIYNSRIMNWGRPGWVKASPPDTLVPGMSIKREFDGFKKLQSVRQIRIYRGGLYTCTLMLI
jgi:hypothetical protein